MRHLQLFEGFLFEREYWGTIGAGILPVCRTTGRVLVGLRSRQVMEPNTWGTFGGKLDIDEGIDESIKEAALREMEEELGFFDHINLVNAYVYNDNSRFSYHNFFGVVEREFEPQLNWEHAKAVWMTIEQLLELPGQHYGLKALLENSGELLRSLVGDATYEGENDLMFTDNHKEDSYTHQDNDSNFSEDDYDDGDEY